MNTKHTTGTPDLTAVRSALPKPKEKEQTQWEMVQSLQDAITAARDAGKTVEQMHADITACGLNIRYGTFRKYVSDLLYEPPSKRGQTIKEPKRAQAGTAPQSGSTGHPERSLRNIRGGKSLGM